jgi:hypothetical protein
MIWKCQKPWNGQNSNWWVYIKVLALGARDDVLIPIMHPHMCGVPSMGMRYHLPLPHPLRPIPQSNGLLIYSLSSGLCKRSVSSSMSFTLTFMLSKLSCAQLNALPLTWSHLWVHLCIIRWPNPTSFATRYDVFWCESLMQKHWNPLGWVPFSWTSSLAD